MIFDSQTTHIYLADTLEHWYNDFFTSLNTMLQQCKVPVQRIKGTADIWARDYMPIQVREDKFVQFNFDPDYLKKKNRRKYKTDTDKVLQNFDLPIEYSNLIVDGVNVVKGMDWVIMTRKVFKENKHIPEKDITEQLEELFEGNSDKISKLYHSIINWFKVKFTF
jgi:agmatine deiminase